METLDLLQRRSPLSAADPKPLETTPQGFAVLRLGDAAAPVRLVWAHGWGQDHRAFLAVCQSFTSRGECLLLDLPGFGGAAQPPLHWGTADYADAAAAWLASLPPKPTYWIGHSYGCRVGIQLAARHPRAVSGLLLVAAAGLPRRRTLHQKLRHSLRAMLFKGLKAMVPEGPLRERLRRRFGSSDYAKAGELRPILVRAVTENLSEQARAVTCPVQLVYGALDDDTPPEIGERFRDAIPGARLTVLPGLDHHTIMDQGRHQIARLLDALLNGK